MMELAQPLWLWTWLIVPAWLWLALRRSAQGTAGGVMLRHPQLSAGLAHAPVGHRLPVLLHAVAFSLMIVALAQPRQVGDWITPPPQGRDLALVIDTSLTMSLEDFELNGRKVSRMAVVKQVLSDFVSARTADRFALLVFGSDAALLTPPTFDHRHVLAQLQRLQVGIAGENTALGDALGMALRPLRQQQLRPAIILVSDGEPSNSGDMSPAEAVAVARQLGVAIHTLEIGAASNVQAQTVNTQVAAAPALEPQPDMANMARLTGGQHWKVRSTTDVQTVMQAIDRLEPTLARPANDREVREWYAVPLGLAIACLVFAQLLLIRRQST